MPHPSKHEVDDIDALVQAVADTGVDPEYVSYPCTINTHEECTGKVMRTSTMRYERCRCLTCNHPKPRVLRS